MSEQKPIIDIEELTQPKQIIDIDLDEEDLNPDIESIDSINLPDEQPVEEINKQKQTSTEVLLKLGDIILITDPTNEILNNNVFIINYIDPKKIKLINSESFEKTTLYISDTGIIGDGSITGLKVISSNSKDGYARQNELLPGTWINVYFSGDIPVIITGKITNLEEDMIELKTTDGDTLFINFNYQGIPEDLPIETFEIRPAPEIFKKKEEEGKKEGEEEGEKEEEEGDFGDFGEEEEVGEPIPTKTVKDRISRLITTDIEFGEIIDVKEYVNIGKEKYRFSIETQTNDLLEEMISNIPNSKRTNNVLNSIHIMITRFIQLRSLASTFDFNKNITGTIRKTAEDKPLADYLCDFKNNLYWILMVASNVKKIYPSNENAEYKQFGDYETIDENTNMLQLTKLFKDYKSNTSIEGQNKYSHLYSSLDTFMTPFYSVNPDMSENIFNSRNGTIIEADVSTNINAIVNNLGNLYSTVVGRSEITNRRFVVQRYNMGLDKLEAANFKGSKLIAHRVKLTNNDPISINSILTLPEPAVKFSQINLPGTDLLVKANLNLHFLNYWQMLKQKTSTTNIVIDGLDNEIDYDDTNFVDNIKQYMLDLSEYDRPEGLTNLQIYKTFLRTIIPKIKVLFTLVKKYIKGKLSLVDVVNYLEPFLIYPVDLTFMQYKEINNFIKEKIRDYNIAFKKYSMAFSGLKNISRKDKFGKIQLNDKIKYIYTNPLFNLLDSNKFIEFNNVNLGNDIFEEYGFQNNQGFTVSGSEFLKAIILDDYGNLFNTGVSITNLRLMFPKELQQILEGDKSGIVNAIEKDKEDNKCTSYIIAKKYNSIEELTQDNGKTIYYDKNYDTTNYDLLNNYKKDIRDLDKSDVELYISEDLKTKYKLNQDKADYLAETLINQSKRVINGEYAILTLGDEKDEAMGLDYYIRNNDEWAIATEIDPTWFIKEDDVLCNIQYDCVFNPISKEDEKCESIKLTQDTIVNNALKQIIDQFDKNYNITQQELESNLSRNLKHYITIFTKLKELKKNQLYKYNDVQYKLGLSVKEMAAKQVVSPYTKLINLIVGQNDLIKRQLDIISFSSKYCRPGDPSSPNIHDGQMEDEWWMYCIETNTKLLPKFRLLLANAFISNKSNYDNVLATIIAEIGKLGDNGDAIVDKHSGEIISYINFDVSEGYKDGFVDKSRSILEKDVATTILENQQLQQKRLSPEAQIVNNMITALSSNMGINIEKLRDVIIKIVTEMMNDIKIIEKEPAYKKREQEAAKKGKKIPDYSFVYSSTLLYLTLGMYLIAIQTSVPSIKTRKTFPGCIRSFTGFPFEGEGDDTGLKYMACVAIKLKDPKTIPWNSIPKTEEKFYSTIKAFIIRYLLPITEIQNMIKEKIEYLSYDTSRDDIPEEHDLSLWVNFLPPLKKFHVPNLNNITNGFSESLQHEIQTGSHKQLEKLLVIESKIISYSMAIQELIQKIVEKKELLLRAGSKPFMDNACCNERGPNAMTTLQYFIHENQDIDNYNQIVKNLSTVMRDIKLLTQGAIMLADVNTKRIFPSASTELSEETIYESFIQLCKFQSSLPLTEEIASICKDKPDYIKKTDSIQEKIEKLKRDDRKYTLESFLHLFQIISRNNIIHISLNKSYENGLRTVLDELNVTDNEDVPKSLTQKLEGLLDNYDVMIEEDTRDMRALKNYLENSNTLMKTELLDFIKRKAKISGTELSKITKFIKNLAVWRFDLNPRNVGLKVSDDGMYNYINFFKNFISLFSSVFPTMISNQNIQQINPPKYWGLSKQHEDMIKEMVDSFYKPLETFYGQSNIANILYEIQNKSRGILLLSNQTPALTNIKIGDKELYSVFDKTTVTLLYEYYILSIFSDYISLTQNPTMVTKMLNVPEKADDTDLFNADFLIEQQLRFTETEQEFVQGDVSNLQQGVAKLLVAYITIMMKSKKTVDISFEDIEDRVFKLKEAEKYTFTDRLRSMNDEEKDIDTILKKNKLGALYSIGLSKGLKEYDPDNFDHDKQVAEIIAGIQNRIKRTTGVTDDMEMDMDVEDALEGQDLDADIQRENDMDIIHEYDDDDDAFGELDEEY
jgi:hypothetical protein